MRWSQAYRERAGHHDTIDTVDTLGAQAPETVHSVNTVNSVMPGTGGDMASRAAGRSAHTVNSVNSVTAAKAGEIISPPFVNDPIERAAIQAEGLPVRRIRKRMMSWARAEDEPQPGDYCGCCEGQLWWTESEGSRGWCCCRCHPPCHLQPGEFRAVAT